MSDALTVLHADGETPLAFVRPLSMTDSSYFDDAAAPRFTLAALNPLMQQLNQTLLQPDADATYRMVVSDRVQDGLDRGLFEFVGGLGSSAPTHVRDSATKRFVEQVRFVEKLAAGPAMADPRVAAALLAVMAVQTLAEQLDNAFQWLQDRLIALETILRDLKMDNIVERHAKARSLYESATHARTLMRTHGSIPDHTVDLATVAQEASLLWNQASTWSHKFIADAKYIIDRPGSARQYEDRVKRLLPLGIEGLEAEAALVASAAGARLSVLTAQRAALANGPGSLESFRDQLHRHGLEMRDEVHRLILTLHELALAHWRPDGSQAGFVNRNHYVIHLSRELLGVAQRLDRMKDLPWDTTPPGYLEMDIRMGGDGQVQGAMPRRGHRVVDGVQDAVQ